MRIDRNIIERGAKGLNNYTTCISMPNLTETLPRPITINQHRKNTIIVLEIQIGKLMTLQE